MPHMRREKLASEQRASELGASEHPLDKLYSNVGVVVHMEVYVMGITSPDTCKQAYRHSVVNGSKHCTVMFFATPLIKETVARPRFTYKFAYSVSSPANHNERMVYAAGRYNILYETSALAKPLITMDIKRFFSLQ